MKLTPYLFGAMAAMAVALSSCGGNTEIGEVQYLPVKLDDGEGYGMADAKGDLLFKDKFEEAPSIAINGYFTVREDGKYTVYKIDEKPMAVKGLDELMSVGIMTEGLIPVAREGKRIELVDESGKTKATLNPIGKDEITSVAGFFSDGLMLFETSQGKAGAINTDGEVVIKPTFDGLYLFSEGVAVACDKKKKGDDEWDYEYRYYIIDKKGEKKCTLRSDMEPMSTYFHDGRLAVRKGEGDKAKCGFIDKKGEFTALPSKVKEIIDYNDDVIVYSNGDGKYGVMDYKGEDIIRAKYDRLSLISSKRFLTAREKNEEKYEYKWKVLDNKGEAVLEIEDAKHVWNLQAEYRPLFKCEFPLIVGEDEHVYYFIDDKGEKIGKEFYDFSLSINTNVQSQYFDAATVIGALADKISSSGFDGVSMGQSMQSLFPGQTAEECRYTDSKELDSFSGFRYNCEAKATSNRYVATQEAVYVDKYYEYWGWDKVFDHYETKFNPESVVDDIYVTLTVENDSDVAKDLLAELDSQLAGKGYKYIEKNDDSATYTNEKDTKLYVTTPSYGQGLNLHFVYEGKTLVEVVEADSVK